MLNQNVDLFEDPVLRALRRYENHSGIKEIEQNIEINFSFSFASYSDIEQQLENLDPTKTSQDTDILTRILKENSELFVQFALKNYNEVVTTSAFSNILKHATVRLVYQKDPRNEVQNYRPV